MRFPTPIAIGFAALGLCQASVAQAPARVQKPDTPALAQWRARVPAIQKTLEAGSEANCRGAPAPGIVDAYGLSTDQLSVALVDYCSGGAYTDSLVPMLLDRGRPVQAHFRDSKGKYIQTEFVSGASVMHSRAAKLVADKKAIFDEFTESDDQGKIASCDVKAYVWNAHSRTFDLNLPLSKSASSEYCLRMRAGQ